MIEGENNQMSQKPKNMTRPIIIGSGITLIVLACVIAVMGVVETVGSLRGNFNMVELPGFHEIELKEPGLYGGIYQHRSSGPMPIQALTQLDVRIMDKVTYEQIPVVMNTTGQTFQQMGMKGMPVFNFIVHKPGWYNVSAIFRGDATGPTIPVMIFAQAAQNVKQTVIVAGLFFVLFLTMGILMLVKLNRWAPKTG